MRWWAAERRRLDDERLHQPVELGERPLVEPAANVAGVDELVTLVDAHEEGAEMFPAVAWRGEAADNDLLLEDRLDLQPRAAADPRLVGAVEPLGHDALQPLLRGRLEEGGAFANDVLRILEQGGIAHDVAQQPLAILERHFEESLAVQVDDVEDDVLHRVLFSPAVL